MSQTRRQSMIEVATGTSVGMLGSFCIAYAVMLAFDDRVTAASITTALCTVWSICRGYTLRRLFNSIR